MGRWWPQLWCKVHSFPEHLRAHMELLLGQMHFTCVSMKCSVLGNIWKVNRTSHSQSPFEFFLVLLSLSYNRSDVKEETCLSKTHLSGNAYSVALSPGSLCFIPFESIHCLSFGGFGFGFGDLWFLFSEGRGISHHPFFGDAERGTQDFTRLRHLLYPVLHSLVLLFEG